jgi:hypothetical protein
LNSGWGDWSMVLTLVYPTPRSAPLFAKLIV